MIKASNLALLTGSVLLTLLLLEAGIRVLVPQPVDYFYFRSDPQPGDVFQRWGVEVRINSHGHRDYNYSVQKAPGVYRVALIGDSVVYGSGVANQDRYAKRLEARLNKTARNGRRFEIITFSGGGNELSGYLDMLRDDAIDFEPDLVMIGFTLSDIEPVQTRQPRTFRRYYYEALTFVHIWMRIQSHLYFVVFERMRNFLYANKIIDKSVRNKYELDVIHTRGPVFEAAWRNSQGLLRDFKRAANRAGASLAIVVFPYEMQLTRELLDLYRSDDGYGMELDDSVLDAKPQKLLRTFAESEGITVIDTFDAFRENARAGKTLYFRELGSSLDWVHPNPAGHTVGADVLYDAFRCGDLLPAAVRADLPTEGCKPNG